MNCPQPRAAEKPHSANIVTAYLEQMKKWTVVVDHQRFHLHQYTHRQQSHLFGRIHRFSDIQLKCLSHKSNLKTQETAVKLYLSCLQHFAVHSKAEVSSVMDHHSGREDQWIRTLARYPETKSYCILQRSITPTQETSIYSFYFRLWPIFIVSIGSLRFRQCFNRHELASFQPHLCSEYLWFRPILNRGDLNENNITYEKEA